MPNKIFSPKLKQIIARKQKNNYALAKIASAMAHIADDASEWYAVYVFTDAQRKLIIERRMINDDYWTERKRLEGKHV